MGKTGAQLANKNLSGAVSHLRRYIWSFFVFCLGTICATAQHVDVSVPDELPPQAPVVDVTVVSNLVTVARAILPAGTINSHQPSFLQFTNALCRASEQGNYPARGLWGVVAMMTAHSPEEAQAALLLIKDSAQNGCVQSMYQLGLVYSVGKYTHQDYNEAFHWFSLAAGQNCSPALMQLGNCYHLGRGTTTNQVMAVQYYRRTAELTNYDAMNVLGYFLIKGIGVATNVEEAGQWFLRAATEGSNAEAMNNLGMYYKDKSGDTNSRIQAFHWFNQGAHLGNDLACYQVAMFYLNGFGVIETNPASYRYWLSMAAMEGNTRAEYEMGRICRMGDGMPVSLKQALWWYQLAAAKNHPEAFYDLAVCYSEDKANPESIKLTHSWMLRAARAGHKAAQLECARYFLTGDGETVDCDAGKHWLEAAADGGWPPAEYFVCGNYFQGPLPGQQCSLYPLDKVEALRWLRRSAAHGWPPAQCALGMMLVRGQYVEQPDLVEGGRLLRLAAEQGNPDAQNDLGYAILGGFVADTNLVESAVWCQLAETNAGTPALSQRARVNYLHAMNQLSDADKLEVRRRVDSFKPRQLPAINPLPDDWDKNPDFKADDSQLVQ
jgi:TPR repeat protein